MWFIFYFCQKKCVFSIVSHRLVQISYDIPFCDVQIDVWVQSHLPHPFMVNSQYLSLCWQGNTSPYFLTENLMYFEQQKNSRFFIQ